MTIQRHTDTHSIHSKRKFSFFANALLKRKNKYSTHNARVIQAAQAHAPPKLVLHLHFFQRLFTDTAMTISDDKKNNYIYKPIQNLNYEINIYFLQNSNSNLYIIADNTGICTARQCFYYNPDGTKEIWYKQQDVFAFRMINGLPYTGSFDQNIVESVDHKSNTYRRINEMHFKPTATPVQKQTERNKARNKPNFECEFLVITKQPNLDKTYNKWHSTNDMVMVTFRDPNISMSEIQQFKIKHDLILDYKPSNKLPLEMRTTYIFRLGPTKCGSQKDAITTAKEIFEQDSFRVKIAEPSIQLYKEPAMVPNQDDNSASSAAFCSSISLNEPSKSRMWQIDNDGSSIIWNGQIGTADADADICDCWAAGYNGYGIKIAVIDFNGFEFTHEDMAGRYQKGFNFVNNTPINGNTYTSTTAAHGHAVSSTIVAIDNNGVGIAGVARHATIIPYIFDGNTSLIIKALDSAIVAGADIVNMSFGNYTAWATLQNKIKQIDTLGRPDQWNPSIKYGTIVVASAGNDDTSSVAQYPAAYPEVIGVGGTNPNDFRGKQGDGWGIWYNTAGQPVGGSNYGPFYEVVAPAAVYWAADYMGSQGWGPNNYYNFNGTSFASPTVAGIAAILLSKNGGLYSSQVRSVIKSGAEKVRPSTYNYNYNTSDPGRSFEMQYGRVSCINSLNSISVGINEQVKNDFINISAYYNGQGQLVLLYDFKDKNKNAFAAVYDILGKEILRTEILASQNQTNISVNTLSQGIYLLNVFSKEGNKISSQKFMKY